MDLEKRLYEALRQRRENPRAPKPDLFKLPPTGHIRATEQGPVWMVETAYDEGYLHGRVELAADFPMTAMEILDPYCHQHGFHFKNVVVIDTETTGLAGGAGTYAFIIGIGFWENARFVVRQYILRDFSEEPSQLSAIIEDIAKTNCILTYNGKTFDLPLLRTRYRINRLPIPFENHLHLDLVHPCRRLFRRHYDSLSLSHLEEKILGFQRTDDVPSHLIPRLYFDYLQHRDDEQLLPILNHNRDDIVSLLILAQETFRRIDLAFAHSCDDDLLLLSLGHILYKAGDCRRSQELLSYINRQFADSQIIDESVRLHSQAAKRGKDWDTAVVIWEEMARSGRYGCYPHIELAKYLEHRARDLAAALNYTNLALKYIEVERAFISPTAYKNVFADLRKRQKRLMAKIAAV